MPLLRGIARTAAIAGTATAVSNRVSRRQEGKWAAQEQQQYEQQQQQMAAQAPAAPARGEDSIAKLKELSGLHESGVLTDEEFAAAKAKVLNI
jgi:membrane protease subunit (stomatin/prohibitin family)